MRDYIDNYIKTLTEQLKSDRLYKAEVDYTKHYKSLISFMVEKLKTFDKKYK